MKSICVGLFLVLTFGPAVSAWSQEYTQDDLRGKLEGETDPLTVGKICGDFMMKATDMVVVLDFWATWCGPCRISRPILSQFVRVHAGSDVDVFSIQVWEADRKKAEAYMADSDHAMHLLFGDDEVVRAYGFEAIPYLCVIDKEGKIRFEERGFTENLMENLIWWTEDLK